jgi:hypothetical protein
VLVQPFCGGVAGAADQIIAGSTNYSIRREALVWKIEAVPILRETLFHPNPYLALGDAWAFLKQMETYFQNGRGKQTLSDSASVAVAACESLEKQLTEVAASLTYSGKVADVRNFVEQWAAEHPIRHSISSRESIVGYFTKRKLESTFSATEAAGDFIVTADDMSRRMDIYGGQLTDQARWQAELLAMDLAHEYQVGSAIQLAGKAAESVAIAAGAAERTVGPLERTATALETAPDIVAKERTAALKEFHEELSRTLEYEHRELETVIEQATTQRVAALLELHTNIAEERAAFTRDLERITSNAVDHALLRTTQLIAVIALVALATVVLLLFITRRLFLTKSLRTATAPCGGPPTQKEE